MGGWRLWLGLAVTAVTLYWTLRGVDYPQLLDSLANARWGPILLMLPIHPLALWVRALRWRYLTRPLAEETLPTRSLFRATAVGFMAINVLPFRVGELIRPWFLARETGVRGSAALGTLVLERAIDFASLLLIGAGVLYFHTGSLPIWVRSGAVILAGISCIPLALIVALRTNQTGTLRLLAALVRPLPAALSHGALDLITEICRGLVALRGYRAVAMVMLYSALLWIVLIGGSFALGLFALGIDFALGEATLAVYTVLVFTALAVAAPSAPGFFGVYHFACREALMLFGVSSAVAVAYGTIVHITYWIPVTIVGGVIAAQAGTALSDFTSRDLGKAPPQPHR